MTKTLSIIIPVFNEEKTIEEILEKVIAVNLNQGLKKEILLINDCSIDNSKEIVKAYTLKNKGADFKYFEHEKNMGKGAALHTGIKNAPGDYLIIQDADLENDPEEFNILLKPILDDKADVLYGSRFIGDKPHRVLYFWHSAGNKFLTRLSNLFSNLNLTDMETCYKAFRADIIQSLSLREKRFGFEPEVTQKFLEFLTFECTKLESRIMEDRIMRERKLVGKMGLEQFGVS